MRRCILLAGGPPEDCDAVQVDPRANDYIIACDAGYRLAERLGLSPDLVVGDFDSLGNIPDLTVPVLTAPRQKDDTDLFMGVREAVEQCCTEFLLLGALGGRLDHTVGNLQVLCWLSRNGYRAMIQSNDTVAWAVTDSYLEIDPLPGKYLSVFAWGGICRGVTLKGLAYPLLDATLRPDFPLGVSNEFVGSRAKISVAEGTLVILSCNKD